MRLGYLTSFSQQALRTAREIGFSVLEVDASSWRRALEGGRGEIRRAAAEAKASLAEHSLAISALAFYENHLASAPGEAKKRFAAVMELAECLGVSVIATMAGRQPEKSLSENIVVFRRVFSPIAKIAERMGMRLAFENWPGGMDRFPHRGVNIAYSPQAWEMMFDAVSSSALGLEFDPSHLYWQQIDHIGALQEFADRIYHVHAKDTEIMGGSLAEGGIYGEGWWRYRLPGFGEVDWAEFISALYEIGYEGDIAIEHEDGVFSDRRFPLGLRLAYNHLAPLMGI